MQDPQPVLSYGRSEVALTIWGVVPEGPDFTCQGNPATTIEVRLSEPLGDRALVPGETPATQWPDDAQR